MTTDKTKAKAIPSSEPSRQNTNQTSAASSRDRRATGYTRVKSGDLKRRSVTRSPDMSRPNAKAVNPRVSLGSMPQVARPKERVIPVASVRVEPTVRTITDPQKVAFPFSIIFMAIICSLLFLYMIFNYVQINEYTSTVSDLKADIATLAVEADELNTKLEWKNDLTLIEKIATEELGMVKIDEIPKKYVTMDPGDSILLYPTNP